MNLVSRLSTIGASVVALFAPAVCRANDMVVPVLAQVTVTKSGAKNYIVESLVTVVLVGLALFVICKSSRRV